MTKDTKPSYSKNPVVSDASMLRRVFALVTTRHQALHDLLAATAVVQRVNGRRRLIPTVLGIDSFHGYKSVRPARIPNRAAARKRDVRVIGQAPPGIHWTPGVPICPTAGRALLAAGGVARRLKCPALRRNSLLSGAPKTLR
jgi:hypothetical protein